MRLGSRGSTTTWLTSCPRRCGPSIFQVLRSLLRATKAPLRVPIQSVVGVGIIQYFSRMNGSTGTRKNSVNSDETRRRERLTRPRCLRQLKDPDGRVAVGRILDLGDQRGEAGGLRAAVADHHGNVLLSVGGVRDGRGIRNVVQANLP